MQDPCYPRRRCSHLKHIRVVILRVLDYDRVVPGQRVRNGMLLRVQYRLRRVRRLHHVVLGPLDAVRLLPLVEHELAAPPAPVPLGQEPVVAEDHQLAVLDDLPRLVGAGVVLFQDRRLGAIRSARGGRGASSGLGLRSLTAPRRGPAPGTSFPLVRRDPDGISRRHSLARLLYYYADTRNSKRDNEPIQSNALCMP